MNIDVDDFVRDYEYIETESFNLEGIDFTNLNPDEEFENE